MNLLIFICFFSAFWDEKNWKANQNHQIHCNLQRFSTYWFVFSAFFAFGLQNLMIWVGLGAPQTSPDLSRAPQTSQTSPELPRPPQTCPELPRPHWSSPDLPRLPQTSPELSGETDVKSMEHQWKYIKVNENLRKSIRNQWRRYAHLWNPKHKFVIPYRNLYRILIDIPLESLK